MLLLRSTADADDSLWDVWP